jgi:DNA-binding CsgD family transcriptional regulator
MKETLALKIKKKTQEIASVSGNIPGVIIIHDLPQLNLIFMSEMGLKLLGKKWDDIKELKFEDFQKQFFNEEDAKKNMPKIVGLLETNTDTPVSYFQQVRTSKTREWDWYMCTVKVLLRDSEGRPILIITVAMQIDAQNYFTANAAQLLEENEFLKNHYHEFARLTKREKEILGLMAKGRSTAQIADALYISETTAETHRKNIKTKIKINAPNDLYMYTHAFDLL